ncbi:MAG: NAD(P)H-dependent glycerol-3-phosphate dehydrogenase [Fimbriimonadaceae bacterium]
MRVTVLGAGSWGTALTILLARNGHDVTLLGRESEETDALRSCRENLRYLPGFLLPENVVVVTGDSVLEPCDMWVVAVPSGAVRHTAGLVHGEDPCVVVASKGLESGSSALLTTVCKEALPRARIGCISGPNLAVEIAKGIPTAAVTAFADLETAEFAARAFNCRTFRVYLSQDVIGVGLAGALKNVLAIAAGMSDGLGFGDNTKGALLARGLREMTLLGMAMGARMETFMGIAGVGDLFATAVSTLSRNYRVGVYLGEGRPLTEALREIGQVAEGVPTSECSSVLARQHQVAMPVFDGTEAVIRERLRPQDAVAMLMERQPKTEGLLS